MERLEDNDVSNRPASEPLFLRVLQQPVLSLASSLTFKGITGGQVFTNAKSKFKCCSREKLKPEHVSGSPWITCLRTIML